MLGVRHTPSAASALHQRAAALRVGRAPARRSVRARSADKAPEKSVEERLGVTLPPEMMRIILGEADHLEKLENYEESLHSWWVDYADRKNNEGEEHVADGLLYDDRTHLPRTVAPPPCVERIEVYRRSLSSVSSIDLPEDHPRMTEINESISEIIRQAKAAKESGGGPK